MATTKEAIIICLDVGPEMRHRMDDNSPTPLEQATECISWILQRKIFTESKDEFVIVLFGTQDTDNNLAANDGSGYANICATRELQPATWDLVKYIQNEIPPAGDGVNGDFLDAIVVSLDLMASSTSGKKYAAKQLVLFSNLGSPFGDDQVDQVIQAIKNTGIELVLFGPHLLMDNDQSDSQPMQNGAGNLKKTQQQELGERYAMKILEGVNGQSYSLTQGLSLLRRFTTRTIRPMPWKCNFEIGTKIKIPITMFVKTKRAKIKQTWKLTHAQDPNAEITIQKTYHKKAEDDDQETAAADQGTSTRPKYPQRDDAEDEEETRDGSPAPMGKEIEKEELVKAYNYGNTIVPLDKMDLEAMKYKNTEKCLKLLSFIDIAEANRQYFLGDGCYLAFPDTADQEGVIAFEAIYVAMRQENRAALVRYAYSARSTPRLGVLVPTFEANGNEKITCFMFVTFPYAEDCRSYEFPTLNEDKLKPSDEQMKAVDDLITSMDLTGALVDETGRRCEAYEPSAVSDPYLQNTFANMAHRALYENQPLPPVNKQLVASISPIEERMQLAKPVFQRIREVFDLKRREEKKEKRAAADIFQAGEAGAGGPSAKISRQLATSQDVPSIKIGTVRPVEEYMDIMEKDESAFEEASEKLQDIISQFIFDAVGMQFYEKAVDCVDIFRRTSIQVSKPGVFNSYLRQLKRKLLDAGKTDFLPKLALRHLGLITDEESNVSSVKVQDASEFFEEKEEKPEVKDLLPPTHEPDLLEELE